MNKSDDIIKLHLFYTVRHNLFQNKYIQTCKIQNTIKKI